MILLVILDWLRIRAALLFSSDIDLEISSSSLIFEAKNARITPDITTIKKNRIFLFLKKL
jgi:hypothetical protein